jgi:hypothetical protein
MADTEEPLPPLDLRGLPSVDAYGNKVNLPQTDSVTGMQPLTGAMPSSAPAQPAAPSTTVTKPALPAVPAVPNKSATSTGADVVGNLVEQGKARTIAEREALNAIPAQLRPTQAPGGTPMPAPAPKTQAELRNEQQRIDYEQARRQQGNNGQAAYQRAFKTAIASGMDPSEARQMAAANARVNADFGPGTAEKMETSFPSPTIPSSNPMMPNIVDNNGQPIRDMSGDVGFSMSVDRNGNVIPTSGGAVGNANIVTTPNGPMLRGADGTSMPFVQDPVTGYTLPISSESSAEDFARNLDPKVRAQTLEVLADGNDPVAQEFQRIDMNMQRVDVDPRLSPRQKQAAKDQLKKQQDGLLWSAMRDPRQLVSSRGRQQAQQEADKERENRQSIAIQERLAKQRQQQNARMYQDAYKRAKQELETDPFSPVSEDDIRNRAQQLYMQQAAQTGAMSPGSQAATSAQPAPAQSGAPDLSNQNIAIEPGSPIDFQQAPNGALVTMVPNPDDPARPTMIRGANFNGRAVAVPRNQAELDMLPPGSLYILEGAVRRGEMREPKRKEGDVPGLKGASAETPEAQDFAIREEATKLGEPRTKAVAEYQTQKSEYDNMMQEAKNKAAKQLGVVLGRGGQPSFEAVGGGERTGKDSRSSEVDPKGQWADAVQKQMIAVAEERYGAGGKTPPEWIRRRGNEIIAVDAPPAPKYGENAAAEEMAKARADYFSKRGTTEFKVRNERMLNEARSSYTVSLRGGKPTVQVGNRSYPGVRIREGNMQAVLPTVESGNRPPQEVANEALTLLTSGKPFAIDIGGRMVPFKLDRNDPRLKAMIENPNKTLSLTNGQIGNNPGVKAAISYIDDVFGYLPVSARKHVLDRMLNNPRLGGYTLTAD